MALKTTVIGSFPKPEYLNLPDWFKAGAAAESSNATKAFTELLEKQTEDQKVELERTIMKATAEVIEIQKACGVQIITDGEVRRENYIHHLCRCIEGIDFNDLTKVSCRNGAYVTELPTVRAKVSWRGPLDVVGEWRKAQDVSSVPVKYTLPGPMTIVGTLANVFYESEKDLCTDLAPIVHRHVKDLVEAGCKHIQIDEPLFARKPQEALDYGIALLDKCFEGVDADCHKMVHICCGYPGYLDEKDYQKADRNAYLRIAKAIDDSAVDAVSIEDAHCHNDLKVLDEFKKTTVILGVVQSAASRVETADEIEDRIRQALDHIEPDRLMIAPDCGLAFLPPPVLKEKLENMCIAAERCRCKRQRLSTKTAKGGLKVCPFKEAWRLEGLEAWRLGGVAKGGLEACLK